MKVALAALKGLEPAGGGEVSQVWRADDADACRFEDDHARRGSNRLAEQRAAFAGLPVTGRRTQHVPGWDLGQEHVTVVRGEDERLEAETDQALCSHAQFAKYIGHHLPRAK